MPITATLGCRRSMAAMALAVAAYSLATVSAHIPNAEEIALGSRVDPELAFARQAQEQGIRAAFLANFAADGIAYDTATAGSQ
jgi:hypothetical protein